MPQCGPGGADGGDLDVLVAPATCQGQGGTVLPPLGLIPDPRGAPLEPRLGRVAEARKSSALGVRGFDAAALTRGEAHHSGRGSSRTHRLRPISAPAGTWGPLSADNLCRRGVAGGERR